LPYHERHRPAHARPSSRRGDHHPVLPILPAQCAVCRAGAALAAQRHRRMERAGRAVLKKIMSRPHEIILLVLVLWSASIKFGRCAQVKCKIDWAHSLARDSRAIRGTDQGGGKRRGQSARLVIAITTPNRPTRVRGSGPRTLGRGNLTEGHRARDGYRKTNPAPPGSHLPHHIGCNATDAFATADLTENRRCSSPDRLWRRRLLGDV